MGPLIVRYVTLFPLLFPVFEQRPLTREDILPGPYPCRYSGVQIIRMREALDRADREMRATLCIEMRQSGLEAGFDGLVEQLRRETDVSVLATILEQMVMSPHNSPAVVNRARGLLRHPCEDVRYWAAMLYGQLASADPEDLFRVIGEDSSETVREAAADRLGAMFERVPAERYAACRGDSNARVRASMVAGACRRADAMSQSDWLCGEATGGPIESRFQLAELLAQHPPELRARVTPILLRDASASVRGGLASSLGQAGEDVHVDSLLTLCRDEDPEARRRAAASSQVFPCDKVLKTYVAMLGDGRTLVRRQVEDALVVINASVPVSDAVASRLNDTEPYVRYHVCRVLGRLVSQAYADDVHTLLKRETIDVNIAACCFALGRFGTLAAAPTIAGHAGHPRAVVREAVAEALGRLAVASTYEALKTLAFDTEEEVRHAAVIGMGRTGDGKAFSRTIVEVLKAVTPDKMTPDNRAAAGWTASRLRPVDSALMQRVKVQATVPVVPGEMGEMLFEEDHVLACMAFALAVCGREDAEPRRLFDEVYHDHSFEMPPDGIPPRPNMLMPSAEVREYARQAQAWLAGKTPEPRPRPMSEVRFSYDASYEPGG